MNQNRTSPARTASPVTHGTFTVERVFRHSPARVFHALHDYDTVRRWRVEGEGWQVSEFKLEFRVGAGEVSRFSYKGGPEIRLDAQYHEIVKDERVVFSYRMAIGEQALSASLTTIELFAEGDGTRLVQTEQGAYFGEADSITPRKVGTIGLLEKLGEDLDAQGAAS
ncbi:MAG TPA: SRPBCC family protein [Ramlibacter sp.]|nr:SRPBCC family protein [Ramlibacter sp.]